MIGVQVKVTKLFDGLSDIGKTQFPFGLALGLNQTGKDVQSTEQRGIQQRFTLRTPSRVLKAVNIRKDDWATKQSLVQRIRVGRDESKADQWFAPRITRHEAGGLQVGDQWIPTAAIRPSFSSLVPQGMRPWALGLWRTDKQTAAGTMGPALRKGKQRTFTIINRQGELVGVFQRYGLRLRDIRKRVRKGDIPSAAERQNDGIKLIWRYQQTITLPPRLGFEQTARIVVRSRLVPNVMDGLARALRTAKVGR